MNKIIFITTTKEYDEYTTPIQINAINSIINLQINKKIIVNSNDEKNKTFFGDKIILKKLSRTTASGMPYVKDIFESGYEIWEEGDILCYINADIMVDNESFCKTITNLELSGNYLISGRRLIWDDESSFTRIHEHLDTSALQRQCKPDHGCCIDYFIHNRELYENLIPPDLIIGRMHWDMWLNRKAIDQNAKTIDITNTCFVFHPNHKYGGDKKLNFQDYLRSDSLVHNEVNLNGHYYSPEWTLDKYNYYTIEQNNTIIVYKR